MSRDPTNEEIKAALDRLIARVDVEIEDLRKKNEELRKLVQEIDRGKVKRTANFDGGTLG